MESEKHGDLAGLHVSSDDLGKFVTVTVETAIYSQESVLKTAYWFTDQCYVFIDKSTPEDSSLLVELRNKSSVDDSLTKLAREFCNRLLDQRVRDIVIKETGKVRDFLVEKAFQDGSKHLDPTLLRSDETAIPKPSETYNSVTTPPNIKG